MATTGNDGRPPTMTDMQAMFNPEIRPPLNIVKPAGDKKSGMRTISKKKFFDTISRKSKRDTISLPTDFRHVVHVGNEAIGNAEETKEVILKPGPAGFGMHLKTTEEKTFITRIAPDGPAAATGFLEVDDIIVAIDGEKISGLKHDEVILRLKEKKQVKLTVKSGKPKAAIGNPPILPDASSPSNTCRVCGNPAEFNCSVCGPHILYCSSACQNKDWPTHKLECKMTIQNSGPITLPTGACRVCRAKNARYRCVCGGAMYCSEKCQLVDWTSHKNSCGKDANAEAENRNKSSLENTFFLAVERHISRMAFINGVFEYIWTFDLLSDSETSSKMQLFPTLLFDGKKERLYVVAGDFISCLSIHKGDLLWQTKLGFPLQLTSPTIVEWNNTLIIGSSGVVYGIERESGKRLWRKLLKPNFAAVTMIVWEHFLFAYCSGSVFAMILTDTNLTLGWRIDIPGAADTAGSLFIIEDVSGGVCEGEAVLYAVCTGAYAIRISDGTILYQQRSSKDRVSVDCACVKNEIMFTIKNGRLTRLDPTDLKKVWSVRLPDVEGSDVTLLQNDISIPPSEGDSKLLEYEIVYVGIDYRVIAVNAATGDVLWMAKLAKEEGSVNEIVTLMKIGEDLIAATAGKVYAISANSGNPLRKAQLPQKEKVKRFISLATAEDPVKTTSCPPHLSSIFRRE